MVPPALLVTVLLLASSQFRLVFVVLGGLLVLQSSQELDQTKLAYLSGVGLAFLVALLNSLSSREWTRWVPFFVMFCISALALLLSLIVSMLNATPFDAWLRDATPYILLAASPIFVRDASLSLKSQTLLTTFFVVAGLLASFAFLVEWMDRRQLDIFSVHSLLLPTPWLPAALLCYSASRVFSGKHSNATWIVLLILVPTVVLATATRSGILFFVGPLVIFVSQLGHYPGVLTRFFWVSLFGVIAVVGFVLMAQSNEDARFISERLESITAIIADPRTDPSYIERQTETVAAWESFEENVIFGTGPGAPIVWFSPWKGVVTNFYVDSGLSYLAKFGLLGIIVMLGWVATFKAAWPNLDSSPSDPARFALIGFIAIAVANLPLSNPLEDKGFAFSILLLLTLLMAQARPENSPAEQSSETRQQPFNGLPKDFLPYLHPYIESLTRVARCNHAASYRVFVLNLTNMWLIAN